MPMRPNLFNLLTEYLMVRKKGNASYYIARTMLEHVDELPTMKIEVLARHAGTTPASITKFCRELGFRGYTDLREPAPGTTIIKPGYLPVGADYQDTVNLWIDNQKQLMHAFKEGFDTPELWQTARRIRSARKVVVVMGIYGFAAVDIFLEQMVDTNITVIPLNRNAEQQLMTSTIRDADLTLVISLTGSWYQEHARELGLTQDNAVLVALKPQDEATVVRLDVVPDLFDSMQTSLAALTMLFTMLSAMVHDELSA